MSQRPPAGRAAPLWSATAQASAVPAAAVLPAFLAGLPARSARVGVGPPLPPSAPSSGSRAAPPVPMRSDLAAVKALQPLPVPSRLWPPESGAPEQSGSLAAVFLAM